MDGPFRADIKLTSGDSVELAFVDFHTPETIKHRSQQRIASLLQNAITVGQSILKTATKQSWVNDQDLQALRGEIGAAEELLSHNFCKQQLHSSAVPAGDLSEMEMLRQGPVENG